MVRSLRLGKHSRNYPSDYDVITTVVLLAILALAIQDQKTIHDTRAWKDYQRELKSAQMLEVRWEKTVKARKGEVVTTFVLYKMEEKVSLEEVGKSKTVWYGSKGIEIEHEKKEARLLAEKPEFGPAFFLEIPGVLKGKGSQLTWRLKESLERLGELEYRTVSVGLHQIDAIVIYTYYFRRETNVMAFFSANYSGMWEGGASVRQYRVKMFDTYALLDDTPFSLEVPNGYRVVDSGGNATPSGE